MLKKILLSLLLLLVVAGTVFCIVVLLQPNTFSVERSTTINAPPAAVFAQVNDLQAWDAWTPWKELDPNPKTTVTNPSAGKGAVFYWSGNDKVGEGTLTIVESKPSESVELEQAFVRPFEGKAQMKFTFVPEASGTKVNWRMYGEHGFFGKAMCLFTDMDAMLGGQFEQGLANIKKAAEKNTAASAVAAP